MKTFRQFAEQAAVAPTPQPTAKPTPKPKVTDASAGVDKDSYGRWKGDVVNLGQELEPEKTEVKPGKKGPDADLPAGSANPNKKKKYDLEALKSKAPGTHTAAERQALLDAGLDDFVRGGKTQSPVGDAAIMGATAGLVKGGAALASKAGLGAAANRVARGAQGWWNKGRNTRIPNENQASWRDLMRDDLAQRGQSDAAYAAGRAPRGIGRPDQAFNPFRPASKGGPGSGPTPAVRQAFERPVRAVRDALRGLRK